jgi:TonB family protein
MKTLAAAILLVGASALLSASAAVPRADLDLARSRYEEAAYEDALKILETVAPTTVEERVQVEQYRALCHIALGHTDQAERAVLALVEADPSYVPPSTIASPKVLNIIAETRRRQVPIVAKKLLESGRASFADKNTALAKEQFTLLLKLLDDPVMADRPERGDYRTLAQGFATLLAAPAAAAPATPAAPAASPSNAPVAVDSRATAPRSFVPAVPILETLPPWTPPNPAVGRTEYVGSLKVIIGADGRVKNATMVKPSHPAYDAALMGVVKSWRYKPATQDGSATESERVIAVRLRPNS